MVEKDDLGEELKKVKAEMTKIAERLAREGILMKPRDESQQAFLEAYQHNLAVEIKDTRYLELDKRRREILDSTYHQGGAEQFESWLHQEVPEGTYPGV